MSNLNLKHLRYFWVVASHGSIAAAAEVLHLTPQTISGQLSELQSQIGSRLFKTAGRSLVLTETGRLVFSYADEMFRLGDELQGVLAGRSPGSAAKLAVGIATAVPKLLAYRVLAPALRLAGPIRLVCHESSTLDLLADLSVHKLDLVLTDGPVAPTLNIRAYNHLLGESGLSFFAASAEVSRFAQDFPKSLDRASLLLPSGNSPVHRALELWFSRAAVTPRIAAEFDDLALMKVFGEAGTGVFAAPTVVENDVIGKYAVGVIGRTDEVKQHFYAISPERRITHPAVVAITSASRRDLFVG